MTTEERNAAYDRAAASGRCFDDAYANELERAAMTTPAQPDAAMTCECQTWGNDQLQRTMLGNGHHWKCARFVPDIGALDLLGKLIDGIDFWASQEDGVPEELWDAYAKAVFIVRGKVLEVKDV
jgi:hypothetical protein